MKYEDPLGGSTPSDEKMCTRHLLRGEFGKKLLHKLILRTTTLEAALGASGMPSKGGTTLLHQHFQHELVNEGIKKYCTVLLRGEEPKFGLLLLLAPPPLFQVWDPDPAGRPRRWNEPWHLIQSHTGKDSQSGFPDEDPILRMASSAEHPTKSTTQVSKNNQ